MRTILVPTDFSKPSKVAVSYAIGLAKKMDARILLVAVVTSTPANMETVNLKKLRESMIKTAQQDADKMLAEFKSEKGKIEITCSLIMGFPVVDKIEEFAVKNKVDVIVMGSKGASGLKKILIGSNSAAVIDNSSVPVIVVPGEVKFKPIKKLVYATDARNFQKEVKAVAAFAKMIDASMEVLHVMPEKTFEKKIKGEDAMITREKLIAMALYPKIHLHIVRDKSVVKGVSKFVESQKADLLAMFTHRLDNFEKMLGKSVTRTVALDNDIPLLAYNKTNLKAVPA